jgi:hypothetical protein
MAIHDSQGCGRRLIISRPGRSVPAPATNRSVSEITHTLHNVWMKSDVEPAYPQSFPNLSFFLSRSSRKDAH